MLDTIYIVDEYLAKQKPGQELTTPELGFSGARAKPSPEQTSSTGFSLLPDSLILAAVNAIPSLGSLFYEEKNEGAAALEEKKRLLAAFLERATFSQSQALEAGYRFQPGHPLSGKSYRKHPLASFAAPDTGHLYIPSEGYDAHVLEERESELIRLLVSLGATRISITKNSTSDTNDHVKSNASVSVGPIADIKVEYGSEYRHSLSSSDTRVFILSAHCWSTSAKLDQKDFFWLAFEPSWKAVLFAREHGGCTEASLELKENTSFSEDSNMGINVKAKKIGGGLSGSIGNQDAAQRAHLINVNFAPIEVKTS